MKVVITGGAGFLGLRLARRILERGSLAASSGVPEAVSEVVLFDSHIPAALATEKRMTVVEGDIGDRACIARLIDRPNIAVFHLASVVSAGAEQGWPTQMQATRAAALGLPKDDGLDSIVRDYIADYLA